MTKALGRALGIDLSLTEPGFCLQPGGNPWHYNTGKLRGMARIERIRQEVDCAVRDCKPDIICIEGYSFGSQGRAVVSAGELGGVVRHGLYLQGYGFTEVAPSQLKKYATGKGNTDKNLVLLAVYKRWGVDLINDNEADAFVLAQIGLALLGEYDGKLTVPQAEVIQAIKSPPPKKKRKKKTD